MKNYMTREQRLALLDRIEVLNKVKALLLLPGWCPDSDVPNLIQITI